MTIKTSCNSLWNKLKLLRKVIALLAFEPKLQLHIYKCTELHFYFFVETWQIVCLYRQILIKFICKKKTSFFPISSIFCSPDLICHHVAAKSALWTSSWWDTQIAVPFTFSWWWSWFKKSVIQHNNLSHQLQFTTSSVLQVFLPITSVCVYIYI